MIPAAEVPGPLGCPICGSLVRVLDKGEQFHQLRAYVLRILAAGVQENPHGAVFQGNFRIFLAAHLEGILIPPFPKEIKGSDDDNVGVAQRVEVHLPRFQELAVDQSLVVAASLTKIEGVLLLTSTS